jgi:PAS domain S-box-containing protein
MKNNLYKYFLIIILLATLVLVAISYLLINAHDEIADIVERQYADQQVHIIKQTAARIEDNMQELVNELKLLSMNPALQQMNTRKATVAMSKSYQKVKDLYLNDISRADKNGIITTTLKSPKLIGKDFSWRAYFKSVSKQTEASPVYEIISFRGQDKGKKGIIVAMPVFDEKGSFNGPIAYLVEISHLLKDFLPEHSTAKSWVVDEQGKVLYHPDYKPGTQIEKHKRDNREFINFMEFAKMGFPYSAIYNSSSGTEVLATSYPINIADTTWAIILETPRTQIRSYLISFNNKYFLGMILGLLTILLSTIVFIYLINKWNKKLLNEIDTREDAEKFSTESELRFKMLMEYSPLPITIIDNNDVVTYVNKKFTKVLGYKLKDLPTVAAWWQLAYPDALYRQAMIKRWEKYLSKSRDAFIEFKPSEYNIRCKNGTELIIEMHGAPIGDQNIIIFNDITEHKNIENSLKRNEAKFRKLANLLPEIVFETDTEGTLTFVNQVAIQSIGFTAQDIRDGVNLISLVPLEQRALAADNMMRSMNGEDLGGTEYRVLRRDGSSFPVMVHSGAIIQDGKPAGIRGIASDITERKQVEEALKSSEARYRVIAETAADLIISINEEGIITYTNIALKSIFGYMPEEVMGKSLSILMPAGEHESHMHGIKDFLLTGKTSFNWRGVERSGLHKDGHEVPLEISFDVIQQDNKYNFIGIVRDVTERKKLEEQLLHSQKMEGLGTLTGGVAHEFNNIMTAIIGFGELLGDGIKKSDDKRMYVDMITSSALRATKLTQSMLAYSRKQPLDLKAEDLNGIVTSVSGFLSSLIPANIELHIKPAQKPLPVYIDRAQIEQVLMNLSTNALDAMKEKGKLTIATEPVKLQSNLLLNMAMVPKGEYAKISISDTGYGIDKAIQGSIFEPFFTTKDVGKGTGLGLSVVYGIIDKHNGYINLLSEAGKGATFTIYLPTSKSKIQSYQEPSQEAPQGGTETILLAEDDPLVRNMIKQILEKSGYTVIEAKDGVAAIEVYKENAEEIKLLLLDMSMPNMGGKEAFSKISEISSAIKVIFMSGYISDDRAAEMTKEGHEFIPKPIDMASLKRKIRAALT